MSSRIGEKHKIFNEVGSISSASGFTSLGYSMDDCKQITFVVGMGSVAADTTGIAPTVTVRQGGDAGLSTSTTIGGATATFGPTVVNTLTNVKSALITMTTVSTLTNVVTLNGLTLTYSTTPTSTASTNLQFGSTIGATAAGGIDGTVNSLASVINNATAGEFAGLTATTESTAALRITANDTASTDVNVASTAASGFGITSEKAQAIIEIRADDLDSTSKYVACAISTGATAVNMSITVIKDGERKLPPSQIGQHIKST